MIKAPLATCIALVLLLPGGCSKAGPAAQALSWDEALKRDGLAAAEASLAAQEQAAETAFLLGAVQFLRAVETILQVRYANYSGALPIIPAAFLASFTVATSAPMSPCHTGTRLPCQGGGLAGLGGSPNAFKTVCIRFTRPKGSRPVITNTSPVWMMASPEAKAIVTAIASASVRGTSP